MKTIETLISVSSDGSIRLPPRSDISAGEHRAVLVVEEQPAPVRPEPDERDHVVATLRAAGVLAEPTPELQQLSAESTLTLEEARALLDRRGGTSLSMLIDELRGPRA